MIRINLLGGERAAAKKKAAAAPGAMQAYLIIGLFAGGAAAAAAFGYLYYSGQIKDLDTQIKAAEKRASELKAIKTKVEELEKKRSTFQKKVDLIETLKLEQKGPVHMLDEISKALPDFVWLTSLDQTGDRLKFQGESNSLSAIADFITALQGNGWFPSVELGPTSETNNIVKFDLNAQFKDPEVAKREKEAAARAAQEAAAAAAAKAAAKPGRK